jgi:hypothetical protein
MFLPQAPPNDLVIFQGIALLAEPRFGVQIVDVRSSDQPREIGSFPMEEDVLALALEEPKEESGPVRIAMALGEAGVSLWSWNGGAELRPLFRWDTYGTATDVAFAAGHLWVADGTALVKLPTDKEIP